MHTNRPKSTAGAVLVLVAAAFTSCYSPLDSQRYFVETSKDNKVMEPLYTTPLYTVYFDYALGLCVLHSAHTWGQQGGGGGGTGIGTSTFRCNPEKIRDRARKLGASVYSQRIKLPGQQAR